MNREIKFRGWDKPAKIITEENAKDLLTCNFHGHHDDVACNALHSYDLQADKINHKPLSYFAELYGKTREDLQAHWSCVEAERERLKAKFDGHQK